MLVLRNSDSLHGYDSHITAVVANRAISTDILECCARVLVIQAARDGYVRATLIPDTVLPSYSGDRAIRFPWAVASRRTGPAGPGGRKAVSCR